MLRSTRRHPHRQIVQWLEERFAETCESHSELVAHHALQGEIWEKAVAYLWQAGARACTRTTYWEVVAYFEQALVALQHLSESHYAMVHAIDLRLDLRKVVQPLGEFR